MSKIKLLTKNTNTYVCECVCLCKRGTESEREWKKTQMCNIIAHNTKATLLAKECMCASHMYGYLSERTCVHVCVYVSELCTYMHGLYICTTFPIRVPDRNYTKISSDFDYVSHPSYAYTCMCAHTHTNMVARARAHTHTTEMNTIFSTHTKKCTEIQKNEAA